MKKIIFCVVLLFVCLFTGCSDESAGFRGFVPSFSITGDVDALFLMNQETMEQFKWTTVKNDDITLPAILMSDVIATASPRAENFNLLLIGVDGLASMISGADLEGCHIAYSEQFSWECVNYNHPISSKIKMLHEIVVISVEDDPAAIRLTDSTESRTLTVGQLRLSQYQFSLSLEGRSEINERDVTVFTPKRQVNLSSLIESNGMMCFVGRDGSILYERDISSAFLEIGANTISYKDMRDVAGVMADAPLFNISEVYRDTLQFLENGERVMIIELDGLGWEMYHQSDSSYMSSLEAAKSLSVFPPLSPVCLASMLTGELPDKHGIHDRSTREIADGLKDIFERAAEINKTSVYIEGSSNLIKTSTDSVLSPDINGMNGTDDEVHANAKKAIAENSDLIFVHFHGIDDAAHEYGPYASETMAKIAYIDELVADLAANRQGKIIITADHGHHEIADGGNHGVLCSEDMLVPYVITHGGKVE